MICVSFNAALSLKYVKTSCLIATAMKINRLICNLPTYLILLHSITRDKLNNSNSISRSNY